MHAILIPTSQTILLLSFYNPFFTLAFKYTKHLHQYLTVAFTKI